MSSRMKSCLPCLHTICSMYHNYPGLLQISTAITLAFVCTKSPCTCTCRSVLQETMVLPGKFINFCCVFCSNLSCVIMCCCGSSTLMRTASLMSPPSLTHGYPFCKHCPSLIIGMIHVLHHRSLVISVASPHPLYIHVYNLRF